MTEPSVTISRRGVDRLNAGHPWIYRSDLVREAAPLSGGERRRGALGRARADRDGARGRVPGADPRELFCAHFCVDRFAYPPVQGALGEPDCRDREGLVWPGRLRARCPIGARHGLLDFALELAGEGGPCRQHQAKDEQWGDRPHRGGSGTLIAAAARARSTGRQEAKRADRLSTEPGLQALEQKVVAALQVEEELGRGFDDEDACVEARQAQQGRGLAIALEATLAQPQGTREPAREKANYLDVSARICPSQL